jgi:hypothetical protein
MISENKAIAIFLIAISVGLMAGQLGTYQNAYNEGYQAGFGTNQSHTAMILNGFISNSNIYVDRYGGTVIKLNRGGIINTKVNYNASPIYVDTHFDGADTTTINVSWK